MYSKNMIINEHVNHLPHFDVSAADDFWKLFFSNYTYTYRDCPYFWVDMFKVVCCRFAVCGKVGLIKLSDSIQVVRLNETRMFRNLMISHPRNRYRWKAHTSAVFHSPCFPFSSPAFNLRCTIRLPGTVWK